MGELDVALVAPNVVTGDGQGRAMLELARALLGRGHRVTVYAHRLDDALGEAVVHRRIPEPPGPRPLADAVFFIFATLLVRRARHDVCCVMGPCALAPAPFVYYAQFSHVAWRASWTSGGPPALRHRLHSLASAAAERAIAGRAAHLVACSAATAAAFPNTCPHTVVPNGVDPAEMGPVTPTRRLCARRALGVPPDVWTVAFVGEHHTNRKGLGPLLAAIAAGDEHLIVAGDGDAAALRARAHALGAGNRVHSIGVRPADEVLAAADAVAVPSLYEPFSLVALEAAATGLPLVLSARAGAAEHLGEAAFLLERPWDPGDIRRALDELRRSPPAALARRLEHGRAVARELAWWRCAAAVADTVEATAPTRPLRDD